MIVYHQKTGKLEAPDGRLLSVGYSGHAEGKNNPEMQDHKELGPIPRGKYKIGFVGDTKTHGPYVLSLTPYPENEMFGRSGFLCHGDSKTEPGSASLGCIILAKAVRSLVYRLALQGQDLEVVV